MTDLIKQQKIPFKHSILESCVQVNRHTIPEILKASNEMRFCRVYVGSSIIDVFQQKISLIITKAGFVKSLFKHSRAEYIIHALQRNIQNKNISSQKAQGYNLLNFKYTLYKHPYVVYWIQVYSYYDPRVQNGTTIYEPLILGSRMEL